MKTFIINLKQHTQRKTHMKTLCDSTGFDYEFVDAIYGKELKDIDKYIKNQEKTIEHIHREMSNGEIGCILSHQNIYNKIIQNNIPYALVLEDDIDFDLNITEILEKICFENLEFDTILLGYHGTNSREQLSLNKSFIKSIKDHIKLYKLNEIAYGAYGYIISLQGASKILKQSSDFILPIDHYTGNPFINNILCLYTQIIHINKKLSDGSILTQEREIMYLISKFKNEFLFLSNKIKNSNSKILIYGFNDLGKLIYRKFKNRIVGIVDKNKVGQKVDDIRIKSIEDIINYNNEIFVVTALNQNYIQEIEEVINLKFKKNKIISTKRTKL